MKLKYPIFVLEKFVRILACKIDSIPNENKNRILKKPKFTVIAC